MGGSLRQRFDACVMPEPMSGCWLWIGTVLTTGYGQIYDHPRRRAAHRISWELHRGEIPHGLCVCHKCDVRSCVNPDHLWLGTHQDNNVDRARKGHNRNQNGENNCIAKLTWDDVVCIRLDDKRPHREIAADYGVSTGTVWLVKSYRNWRRYDTVWRRHGR
jgi:hypothetical protein